MKQNPVVVLVSGGIDSAACLHYYLHHGFTPTGLFIDYGQAVNVKEFQSAQQVTKHYTVELDVATVDLKRRFGAGEIIGRNAFFVLATLVKYSSFQGLIGIGIHAGSPYYDSENKFTRDLQVLLDEYTAGTVKLDAPFLHWQKSMIYEYCRQNAVPIEMTYSCEVGETVPCKQCRSCLDRLALNAG